MSHLYARDIRILVIDNNPADVWLLREALRISHFPVQLTVARDGIEATRYLRQLEANRGDYPDLVLLDLNLPRRSGREVLADIKRSATLQTIPVVILSSSLTIAERRRLFQMQAAEVLTKLPEFAAHVEVVRGLEIFWQASPDLRQTARSFSCWLVPE